MLWCVAMDCTTCPNFRASSHMFSPSPSFRLQSSYPFELKISKLKRLGVVRNRLVVRCSFGSDEYGSFNGLPFTPNKLFMQEAIGAEYGEGFETFRADGPLKVDVDYLNDKLQDGFLQRIRYAMKPDEAYGLIFSWDNVVADTRALRWNAWKQLASEEGKDIPDDGDVQRSLLYAGADHVLQKHFLWDKTENELDRLTLRFSQLYYDNLLRLERPMEGLKEWLEAVYTARIPCAVVSSLDRRNMAEALERMGLNKYFQVLLWLKIGKFERLSPDILDISEVAPIDNTVTFWLELIQPIAIVTEEDGMESMAHRFLSAAVKLDRKPSKCVVFEDDPRGVTAAHNCTMMAVALIGAHPAYHLGQADLAVASFSELSVINLRRLFANKGSTFMELQKQIIEKAPPKRKLTTDTIF